MVAENRPRLVKKPYLQSADDANPDHIALNKTVIRTNDEQFWLYAAVDSDKQFPACPAVHDHYNRINTAVLRKLQQKHNAETAVFLVNYAQHLAAALRRIGFPISDDAPWKSECC